MELLTGYAMETSAVAHRSAVGGWGPNGIGAVRATDRARSVRRPSTRVFYDERRRTGAASGGGGGGRGGTYQSGLFGEEVVADRLVADGWRVLGHRVRTRVGELDLVARRGDTVVFAEVKTASPGRLGAEECVGAKQRLRIRRAAVAWMASNPRLQRGVRRYRFDVYLVRRDPGGAITRIDHVKDAF